LQGAPSALRAIQALARPRLRARATPGPSFKVVALRVAAPRMALDGAASVIKAPPT